MVQETKKELKKLGHHISRHKISRIMKENGVVSNYAVLGYKIPREQPNEAKIANKVNRNFDNRKLWEIMVSDLTYVRVGNKWNYICLIVDLHNREIVGYSVGKNKDS